MVELPTCLLAEVPHESAVTHGSKLGLGLIGANYAVVLALIVPSALCVYGLPFVADLSSGRF